MVIGLPLSEGDQQIANFIEGRGVNGITHVLGTDNLWGQLGGRGLPSWTAISADGQVRSGVGALPGNIIDGSWTT